jgi:hypothetical protein
MALNGFFLSISSKSVGRRFNIFNDAMATTITYPSPIDYLALIKNLTVSKTNSPIKQDSNSKALCPK